MLGVGSAPGLQSHSLVVCPQSLLCTGVVGSGRSGCTRGLRKSSSAERHVLLVKGI